MNLRRIVFPTDFSERSQPALELATSLARDSGATLVVVHVQEPPIDPVAAAGLALSELRLAPEVVLEELHRVVPTDPAVPVEHHLLVGIPAKEIVRFADKTDADLIVMGTHGRRGLAHLLMGSVAEAVVRRANCPVLTVRTASASKARSSDRPQPAGVE